ncbi:MAG: hypothetical protein HBSAPP03_27850 [Phycisphaerae bacterium]|nr:MAG: hypothetical protein HBSAPP03_27850 [Phycisphaerae bacterium]
MKNTNLSSVMGRMVVGVVVAAGAVAPLAWATHAQAQPEGGRGGGRGPGGMGGGPGGMFGGGMGGMRDAWMGPALSGRQLDRYSAILGLTDDQKEAAAALVEGYQSAIRQQGEKMRETMEEIRSSGADFRDPEVRDEMRKATETMRTERKKLDDGMFADVKSLLTPAQAEKWPAFERAVRRESGVRRGVMSGERVNLFDVVDALRLGPSERQPVDAVLSEYDVELDRALTARNTAYEEAMTGMMDARGAGNMEAMQKLLEKGREAGIKVKDVNKKFARQVAETLPEERRAEFELAVKRASFPDVYRETPVERGIAAALNFDDLTESQRESIRAIRERVSRGLGAVNDRLARAQEEQENTATIGAIMQRFGGRGEEPTEIATARTEKRELNESGMEGLRKVLTPEQAAKLPRGDENRGRGNFGGDEGGPRRRQQGNDRN